MPTIWNISFIMWLCSQERNVYLYYIVFVVILRFIILSIVSFNNIKIMYHYGVNYKCLVSLFKIIWCVYMYVYKCKYMNVMVEPEGSSPESVLFFHYTFQEGIGSSGLHSKNFHHCLLFLLAQCTSVL